MERAAWAHMHAELRVLMKRHGGEGASKHGAADVAGAMVNPRSTQDRHSRERGVAAQSIICEIAGATMESPVNAICDSSDPFAQAACPL